MLCYFCEEEIEFSMPSEEIIKAVYGDLNTDPKQQWRHVATGNVSCACVATPSNILVD